MLPRGLIWKITLLNITTIVFLTIFIGWSIYTTACSLTAGIGDLEAQKQGQFNTTLLYYVLVFIMIAIFLGVSLHLFFTRKILRPIQKLIDSTKLMKRGRYPKQITVHSRGEISELIEQFNEMVKRLERNELERNKTITNLSHEIRTPLSNLSGYLKALSSGVIEGKQDIYSSLYHEAQRMSSMIEQLDQLKEWDRKNSGDNQYTEVRISELVNQCVAMFQLKLAQEHIDVNTHVEDEVLYIRRPGIEQVVNNIFQNAIQYYEGKGEAIAITGERCLEKNCYFLSITGPSKQLSDEERLQIFNRFYRVDSSRSRETGGTGLGLAIAKEIVHYHGGSIGVHSENNANTFWFTIPLHE